MPHAQIDDGVRLYYELTGPGGRAGRPPVRRRALRPAQLRPRQRRLPRARFRLLSFDARGYGASSSPARALHDRGLGRRRRRGCSTRSASIACFVHGTSMGGMIAIAFTAKLPGADDRRLRRRRLREAGRLPADAVPRLAADGRDDAVGRVLRPRDDAGGRRAASWRAPRARTSSSSSATIVGLNDPYTVRQACLAMEEMDLSPLVPQISRPLLMTNGTHDILCPPDLAPSGLGARKMAELNEHVSLVEFPDIGHADLVECPEDAVRIVTRVLRAGARAGLSVISKHPHPCCEREHR